MDIERLKILSEEDPTYLDAYLRELLRRGTYTGNTNEYVRCLLKLKKSYKIYVNGNPVNLIKRVDDEEEGLIRFWESEYRSRILFPEYKTTFYFRVDLNTIKEYCLATAKHFFDSIQ